MLPTRTLDTRKSVILLLLGSVGIASVLPVIPNLVALTGELPPVSNATLQAASFAQSCFLLAIAVVLGVWLAPKANLETPLIDALLDAERPMPQLTTKIGSAVIGGIAGGTLLLLIYGLVSPHLPASFLENAATLQMPVTARLLYGGITEEILIRWGLMTALVVGFLRLTRNSKNASGALPYVLSIVLSAIIFGLGHLPVANLLSNSLTVTLVIYIIFTNSLFGVIAGYLFWKQGLETAIAAHMIAHLTMLLGEQLLA
jgi:hypothetical protein